MNTKERKLIFIFFAILAIGLVVKGIPFAIKTYQTGVDDIQQLKDKRKRLKKLLARNQYWKAEFDKTTKKAQQLEKQLYRGQSAELMAGRLQADLKTLTKKSQIKVDSMSLPDLKYYEGWLLIHQTMTFKTNAGALMRFLTLIKEANPKLIITDLQVRAPASRRGRTSILSCTVKVIGFSRIQQEANN